MATSKDFNRNSDSSHHESLHQPSKQEPVPAPGYHFKCRFDPEDRNCDKDDLYTRTTDIHRYPVRGNKIGWHTVYRDYDPTNFTAPKIKKRQAGDYKDPAEEDNDFSSIKFNHDTKCSHHGDYKVEWNQKLGVKVPLNPVGRTGLCGRGHLGKWGPNHAADPVVTRWKKDAHGKIVKDERSGKPILQFVAVQRRDTKEWAIPGGMIERGEYLSTTLAREFAEEALNKEFDFITKVVNYKVYALLTETSEFKKRFNQFFLNGVEIYRGYVDDPRNTDNSWMETNVWNFHDENDQFVPELKLEGGSDAESAKWTDMNSSLKLFASHAEFLYEVAVRHGAHW